MGSRRPRLPGFALAGISALIFALVGVIALTARAVPPPTVSELAPQAARQITESFADQAAGPGGPGAGGTTPGIRSPSDGSIDVSRVKRCIGDPPRQIEDPQSPPCVPYWEGNNGGATWQGVTRDEIRVAVANYLRWDNPLAGPNTPKPEEYDRMVELYERFFNERFTFYGRQLNLIPYRPARFASAAPQMKADAVYVDEELHAFAATQYTEQDGRHYVFFDALAERKILGVLMGPGGMSHVDEAHMRRFAPYQWDYTPSIDRFFRGYGEFICNVLAHRPPRYAAPPESERPERVFGIIVDTQFRDTDPVAVEPLRETLAACDEPLHVVYWGYETPPTTALLALRDKGVTDVMYTGQTGILALRIMPEAEAQGYHPEWLVWNLGYQDSDAAATYFPKGQIPHVIGLQVYNKALRPEDMPHVWAAKEMDPESDPVGDIYEHLYKSLLVLASGIQMAGPELTPATFEQGLFATEFPNPGAAGPPYYQARVGFPGIHTMQQDMTMVWLSASERSPTTGVAPAYCYVRRGLRYGLGEWPRDAAFHQGACR